MDHLIQSGLPMMLDAEGDSVPMTTIPEDPADSIRSSSAHSSYHSAADEDPSMVNGKEAVNNFAELSGKSTFSEQSVGDTRNVSCCFGLRTLCQAGCYRLYVLFLLLLVYMLNQLDRYLLAIVNRPMSQDLHYGDTSCMLNDSHPEHGECDSSSETLCLSGDGSQACKWDYNGQGYLYQTLAGPLFIVMYTVVGVPLSFAADIFNRKLLLAAGLTLWSAMTLVMGFAQEYWQLALLRFGLGIGTAACSPFATSLISDYFYDDDEMKSAAAGVYNWAVYLGYSASYAVGNMVTDALNWRWAFICCGLAGLLLALVIMVSLREPDRRSVNASSDKIAVIRDMLDDVDVVRWYHELGLILRHFATPSIILLCVAGCVRQAAGYIWAYNTQPYYEEIGQSASQIARYMSWVPLVGGTLGIVLAVSLSGIVCEREVNRVGPQHRLLILIASQVVSAPFMAGALFLEPPYAYVIMIPGYMLGEAWAALVLVLLLELVPDALQSGCFTVYIFITTIVGGVLTFLVPLLQDTYENNGLNNTDALRASLYILSPGLYLIAAVIFTLTIFVLNRDIRNVKQRDYETIED